ncbi:DUF418 domain-containing protein [Streptomonospora nanhaiensis]|uniref:DUF418 domain-containing protein n=1 Tax=Streptomonospora nanhaiensis TaxID=1323731 RepID=A0A853BK24_9ACTN|nr:DUF418 domain-containing protein [Streptomonospora nanhaiensis]MBV2362449.1 DUF418 domain-containing protein [Streptomonospora nanhaiensis]MBX9390778.1 DUF418 domain-containing protein [Streptomonospora nanhaiensis]NYI94892.1 uncharacterized protein [Streptomonospora nanhaiensis]
METTADRAGAAPAGSRGGGRLPLLDVLRGVAILGTLATNIWIFASPGGEWAVLSSTSGGAPESAVEDTGATVGAALEAAMRFAANGKFLALLTLLFGAGLAIQFRSAARRGNRWPGRYKWRALLLFAEGTLHFVLVFAWDVLMGYAVTALLVAWLLTRSRRAQRVALWVSAGAHVLLMALLTAALVALERLVPPEQQVDTGAGAEVVRLYAEGGYLEQVAFRLENAGMLRIEPVLSFALLVFLFLLGVRLFRAGAFSPDAAGRAIRTRLLLWGLGAGVPLNLATTVAGGSLFLVDRYIAAPIVALGIIGLVGRIMDAVSARRRAPGVLVTAFSSLGRTALSGYVLQNVLAMLACYGIGLGLAARLEHTGPWWVMGLWAAICLVLLTAATLWLRRFGNGPLEAAQKWVLARIPEKPARAAARAETGPRPGAGPDASPAADAVPGHR